MSLDKSIEHVREHRKPYYKNMQELDRQCQPHGACPWCAGNRMHNAKVREMDAKEQMNE